MAEEAQAGLAESERKIEETRASFRAKAQGELAEAKGELAALTEANLGDGLFPAPEFLAAGGAFGVKIANGTIQHGGLDLRDQAFIQGLGSHRKVTPRTRQPPPLVSLVTWVCQ